MFNSWSNTRFVFVLMYADWVFRIYHADNNRFQLCFHHGGILVHEHKFAYKSGKKKMVDILDIDTICYWTLLQMVKALIYDIGLIKGLYYKYRNALRTILDDQSVNSLCGLLKKKALLAIYVKHGKNTQHGTPMPVSLNDDVEFLSSDNEDRHEERLNEDEEGLNEDYFDTTWLSDERDDELAMAKEKIREFNASRDRLLSVA